MEVTIFDKQVVPMSAPQVKIHDVLRAFNKNSIRFIQVGASDGKRNDYIHDKVSNENWSGILIEPVLKSFRQLSANYRKFKNRVIFMNVAVSDRSGEFSFYVAKNTAVSSFNREHPPLKFSKTIMSMTMTLNEIILQNSFSDFDLLQVDAEGHDFHVLRGLNLKRYQPRIIHYEHRHLGEMREECEQYLLSNGYSLYFNRNNTIGVKESV